MEEKLVSQQEEIARLDRITERLLLLARFDAGAYNPNRQEIDFSELVNAACEDVELLTWNRGVTLETDVVPGVKLLGDPVLLRRVVLNLLDNAAKFNSTGGSLSCRLINDPGDTAELIVSNSGPGIPEAERERIFERFYRTDAARVRAGPACARLRDRRPPRAGARPRARCPPRPSAGRVSTRRTRGGAPARRRGRRGTRRRR